MLLILQCDNKIKKKGHGYPPSVNTQYGAPVQASYNNYGGGYDTYVQEPAYHHKVKGHKGHKKGGGVTDLISGFLNSYSKPKIEKGYKPSKNPTYLAPSAPQAEYGVPVYVAQPIHAAVPSYVAPKPAYIPSKPAYVAPKPAYSAPKPAYSAPAPTYGVPSFNTPKPIYDTAFHKKGHPAVHSSYSESSYSAPVKAKYVPAPAKVATVFTHTVAPVEATKVQHLHSHTHVYHGAQVIKPGSDGYVDSHHNPSGSYSTSFKKKSDDHSNVVVGAPVATSFSTSSSSSVSGGNPFDSQSNSGSFNNDGFSSHTKFIAQENTQHSTFQGQASTTHNSFQGQNFQPSQSEFGFKPSTTIEQMLHQNHLHQQFSRTIYRTDCHCVAEQYCSANDVIRGERDLGHIIDARNEQNAVYSNATSEENETDTSARTARNFDFDDTEGDSISVDATEAPEYYDYEEESSGSGSENVTESVEVVRRKRDTKEESTDTTANFSDVQGVS